MKKLFQFLNEYCMIDTVKGNGKKAELVVDEVEGKLPKKLAQQLRLPDAVATHTSANDKLAAENVKKMTEVGRLLGDITACQAIYRELEPGETREGLLLKVATGLPQKKFMSMSDLVDSTVQSMLPPAKRRAVAPTAFAGGGSASGSTGV